MKIVQKIETIEKKNLRKIERTDRKSTYCAEANLHTIDAPPVRHQYIINIVLKIANVAVTLKIQIVLRARILEIKSKQTAPFYPK